MAKPGRVSQGLTEPVSFNVTPEEKGLLVSLAELSDRFTQSDICRIALMGLLYRLQEETGGELANAPSSDIVTAMMNEWLVVEQLRKQAAEVGIIEA